MGTVTSDVPTRGRVGTEDLENPPKTTCPLTCVPERGSNRIHSKIIRVVVWGIPRTSDYPKKPSGGFPGFSIQSLKTPNKRCNKDVVRTDDRIIQNMIEV